jgi:hypothetical protein
MESRRDGSLDGGGREGLLTAVAAAAAAGDGGRLRVQHQNWVVGDCRAG